MASWVYPKLIGAQIRSQTSYRTSFALMMLGQIIAQGTELAVILALFNRIDHLGGFSIKEVLLMYAIAGIAFGLADIVAGQFEELGTHIKSGEFDLILLRPLRPLAQVMVTDVRLRRLGRLIAPLITLCYALTHNNISWSLSTIVLLAITPLCGAIIFGSMWIAGCSVSFWIVDGREFANSVTYGSNLFASYPLNVFTGWLQKALAFVVPGAFIAYFPTLILLNRPDPLGYPSWLGWLSPVAALAMIGVAALVWSIAIRYYRGTGS